MFYPSFQDAFEDLRTKILEESDVVHSKRWQGAEIANNPNMACFELTHVHFSTTMPTENLDYYRENISPDLPWADDHFNERTCGYPINPGTHWANWSHNSKAGAAHFLDERGKFNHNYMERYWPKFAGSIEKPTAVAGQWQREFKETFIPGVERFNKGILYPYGDLGDVVDLLLDDPYTRQAYLPVWFPEDTGGGAKRAPCTIGYHFLMRNGAIDINYHIRSCDIYKHLRNDLYLTARLLLWVLARCRSRDTAWKDVRPGQFHMQIGSLHLFKPDWDKL
jgi:hypothetical protein